MANSTLAQVRESVAEAPTTGIAISTATTLPVEMTALSKNLSQIQSDSVAGQLWLSSGNSMSYFKQTAQIPTTGAASPFSLILQYQHLLLSSLIEKQLQQLVQTCPDCNVGTNYKC
jgi:hypothetical protein